LFAKKTTQPQRRKQGNLKTVTPKAAQQAKWWFAMLEEFVKKSRESC
jgi:hypothetical protein